MSLKLLYSICRINSNSKSLWISRSLALPRMGSSRTIEYSMKPIYKSERAKQIKIYIIDKYMQYFKICTDIVERRFPKVLYLYRLLMFGTREFFIDLRQYMKIIRALNIDGKCLKDLTLKEIELYEQMPKDMRHVAPILTVSMLPFAYFVIFPLMYCFPRQLLSRHYWDLQQKSEFSLIYIRHRLVHNKPVFRHLQLQLKKLQRSPLFDKWSNILGMLGSGVHPTAEQVLECMDLFVNGPYHLMHISGNHVKHLLKMHEVHLGWFRRTRLGDRALVLQAMDKVILQEGIQRLHTDTLKNACYIRGLNPMNMRNEDMVTWLSQWILISVNVNKDSLSLLLHCPVLLGYNEPSNWQLIYPRKHNRLD